MVFHLNDEDEEMAEAPALERVELGAAATAGSSSEPQHSWRSSGLPGEAVEESHRPPPVPSIDLHSEPRAQSFAANEQVCVPRPSEPPPPPSVRPSTFSCPPTRPIPPFRQPPAPTIAPPVQSNLERFAATTPSLGRRPLQRQNSMPSAPPRRARASSFSPARRASPTAGPSNPAQLDPDHHWLSEDEGTGSAPGGGLRTQRRDPARRRGEGGSRLLPGSDDDDEEQGITLGGKQGDLSTFGSTTHRAHPIHHRPSGLVTQPDEYLVSSSSPNPPLSYLIPILIPLVTCLACHRLFVDPTTLNCGHSLCIGCSSTVVHRANDISKSHGPTSSIGMAPVESQFARNPSTPLATSPSSHSSMARTPSAGTLVSSFLQRTRSTSSEAPIQEKRQQPLVIGAATVRTRVKCPHGECSTTSRERTALPFVDAKGDVALQKVMHLLRTTVPGVDEEVERARFEMQDEDEDYRTEAEIEKGLEGMMKFERSSSGSSAGGGEDPEVGGEDSKRVHRTRAFTSSKRTKRPASRPRTTLAHRLQLDLELGSSAAASSTFLADLLSELECQICVQLLHNPVTSSCGHTFCQTCLARAYDHSDKCPLCRADFPSFTYFQSQPINATLRSLILALFPDLAAERLAAHRAEMGEEDDSGDRMKTPLFVCTLAWPGLPTYIHIFEPRYRLMIRRALQGDRQFGMVLPSRTPGELNEFGTMLYIQSCNMIEDGRSIIECVGMSRFRVLERGTLDGYTVGRVERVEDVEPEQERELEQRALASNFTPGGGGVEGRPLEMSTEQLMGICLEFVRTLRKGSAPWVIQRLNNTSE